jgi:hypothetical protein
MSMTPNYERLRAHDSVPRDAWEAVLKSDPNGNVHQSPAWVDAICATGAYVDASRLYESPDGRQLILPMVRRSGLSRLLPIVESMPAPWGTGGILASNGDLRPEDVSAVLDDLRSGTTARIRIRPETAALTPWRAAQIPSGIRVETQVKSVVDLHGGFGQVWARFKGAARTAIRKAERSGLEVDSGCGNDYAHEYYRLYRSWVERRARERGLPTSIMLKRAERAEPLRKFLTVSDMLGPSCRFWLARHEGTAVAAAITLVHGTHATYWRSFSQKSAAAPVSANNLLQKHMIEYASELGCADYNMGWSGTQSLLDYKRSFGAVTLDFPVYSYDLINLPGLGSTARTLAARVARVRPTSPARAAAGPRDGRS